MPFRATIPRTVKKPTSEPIEMMPAADVVRRQYPADQGHRQGHEGERRQADAPERGEQDQEDPDHGDGREQEEAGLGRLSLRVLAQHLGVDPERELDRREILLQLLDHGAEVTALHVGAHGDRSREGLTRDRVRCRDEPDVGHVLQLHVAPVRGVELHLGYVVQAVARRRRAEHVHVVRLAVPEDVADLFARQHRRRRSAHVARLQPVALGLHEVDIDPDLRDVGLELDVLFDDAVDVLEDRAHLVSLGAQSSQIFAEDAHDDRVAGPGEDLVDPLVQVGLPVPEEPREARDDLVDGGDGLLERRVGVDADPVLAEVHAR